MKIVEKSIKKSELLEMCKGRFGDLIKAVVDIEKNIMALGGELHSDEEELLLQEGSQQQNLWGINIYPNNSEEELIEFDSMINLRPSQGNRSRGIEDPLICQKIMDIVRKLVEEE